MQNALSSIDADNGAPARAARLSRSIDAAAAALAAERQPDGHWIYELEADVTIPAEYVLFTHYLGETPDTVLEGKIGAYLRRMQASHSGWPLFENGAFDISASVKAYFALKMIGDDPEEAHMRAARAAILAHGGASKANVFTRFLLAFYGEIPWRAVPEMPVEILLLPRWFPFHLSRVSYWARSVMVPLLVLQTIKPRARNTRGVRIGELFAEPPERIGPQPRAPHQKRGWFYLFDAIDRSLRVAGPLFPAATRQKAINAAVSFVTERLNGEDGLGGIFPAMVNAVMMYDCLGRGPDDPDRALARKAVDKLLVIKDAEAYCQPCLSPVWDTVLATHALFETGDEAHRETISQALDWLEPLQVLDVKGDWAMARPDVAPGGWAFQYANPHYPDLDDTAVIVMAMDRARRLSGEARYDRAIGRARDWIAGLQSQDGGWGAFDANNNDDYLNNIPFADHGALLDPPSPDLTGRCLSMLAQLGEAPDTPLMRAGIGYLLRTQRNDGSWFGRWGVNYVYGTWSALSALNAIGMAPDAPAIKRAADWLISIQNEDGGWGEDCDSYKLDYVGYETSPSTASQTGWALLGLMAAGCVDSQAVSRGVNYLVETQGQDGLWTEALYTGTGFPRVFYLRYHGYPKYFPLWALARYRNLQQTNSGRVAFGV